MAVARRNQILARRAGQITVGWVKTAKRAQTHADCATVPALNINDWIHSDNGNREVAYGAPPFCNWRDHHTIRVGLAALDTTLPRQSFTVPIFTSTVPWGGTVAS
jgi:hypothetical protein